MIVDESYSLTVNEMTKAQVMQYLRSVGKAANQRLREMESQELTSSSAAYRYVKRQASDRDKAYGETGKGQIKFNLKSRGRSFSELRHTAAEIEKFMEARSSTTSGVKKIYEQMANTFKESHGEMTKDEYKTFTEALSNTVFRNFEKIYGSEIAISIANKGLSDEELEKALADAGFTQDTDREHAPALEKIETAIEDFKANKKGVNNNENPVKNANPLA